MTGVKICGVTRPQDAEKASRLGAAYIGVNFAAGSPRRVEPAAAGEICAAAGPHTSTVAVFVDEDAARIEAVLAAARFDLLQFHRPLAEADTGFGLPVVAVCRVGGPGGLGWPDPLPPECRAVLLDAYDALAAGGTGRTFSWSDAAQIACPVPVWLAGGLHAGNVAAAIARVRPAVVDTASGVEFRPGVKDDDRLARFFEEVRRAG
jgi:phosphoribosylanthranilate isomerase